MLGLGNTIDNQVTRTMLSRAGHQTSLGLHQVGVWMPSSVQTQAETTRLLRYGLKWQLHMRNETDEVFQNVTRTLNFTVCNLQAVNAKLQQERFVRAMTANNPSEWRRIWNISDSWWLQVQPELTTCNEIMCMGHWVQYNVSTPVTICKFHVLPVITPTGYWFLRTKGDWFSPQTNFTYDLRECESTDKGVACLLRDTYQDPCLTERHALCDWYHEPARDMLWQIGPHVLCIATTAYHPQLPRVPFSGCLHGVHLWHWNNETYHLTNYSTDTRLSRVQWDMLHIPWRVSLDRFRGALSRSTELKTMIDSHGSNVSRLMVSTLISQGKVLHAAKLIEQDSAHHWWDIFSGMSVTARTYVLPPLLIIMALIVIMTLCNIGMCVYVRRTTGSLKDRLYNMAFQ